MSTPPKVGGMKLHDSVVPDLTAGLYRVTSALDIRDGGTTLEAPADQRTFFDVFAPRFALDPSEVSDCFPPPGGKGAFGTRLPHIALWRRTLPWSRRIDSSDAPGEHPWLALLLLREDEATIENAALSAVLPAGVVSDLANGDPIDGDPEVAVLKVNSIDTFRKVMPRRNELALLSHVRQVNLADTTLAGQDDDGWISVIVANRLPLVRPLQPEQKYVACLVSLEARDDVFSTAGAQEAPPLVLLYAWRFTSAGQGGTFEHLAETLNVAAFCAGEGDDKLLDEFGRLSVDHTRHSGETATADYRGPLLGVSAQALPKDGADISLPSAFELGRLLGIADGRFLREMVDWHRKAEAEIRAELETEELASNIGTFESLGTNLTVASLQQGLLQRLDVANLTVANFGQLTFLGDGQ